MHNSNQSESEKVEPGLYEIELIVYSTVCTQWMIYSFIVFSKQFSKNLNNSSHSSVLKIGRKNDEATKSNRMGHVPDPDNESEF